MSEKCPWNTRPKTIKDMAYAIEEQTIWEKENKKAAPMSWCLVPTKEMFYDLITRLVLLEEKEKAQKLRRQKSYE